MQPGVGRLFFACFLLSSCSAKQPEVDLPFPNPVATCLIVGYAPEDSTGDAFPTRLALDPATRPDSGRAFWLPPADSTSRIWEMFFPGGSWRQPVGDSLHLHFSNGFTSVILRLQTLGDSVAGEAMWLSDVVGQDFSAPLAGRRVQCPWS